VLALWRNQQIQIVTVTSNEALKNLYHILNKSARELLLATPLVVPGERCGELARQTGFETILTAANATDQAMLDTIQQWHNR
jgi:uroporphyrinogen-III synthase